MAGTFKFELVSPERVLLSADVTQVEIPGTDGDMTVMAGHAPLISTLLPGMVRAVLPDGIKRIYVKSGLVEINPETVTLLAEHAFVTDEIDPRQLEAELNEAEAALKEADSDDARMHVGRAIEKLKTMMEQKR